MKMIRQVLVLVTFLSVGIYQENTESQNVGKNLWHQKLKNDYPQSLSASSLIEQSCMTK